MRRRAILLIIIQCLFICSIAGKYLYERATCPRVWVRVAQYDPNLPMRGRYLALSPLVDACSLLRDDASNSARTPYGSGGRPNNSAFVGQWRVITKARNGKLIVEDASNILPRSETQAIWLNGGQTCDLARLTPGMDFFIPDTAKSPFPSKPGEELWVEVTVPPAGPPRPIQLAVSDNGVWKPLHLN